ncbi:hypothetical protein ACFV2X_13985 [Streptomyces sp. NPDC059679]|uniref:hypothetical protein n=1 Tax=Streptomyces sp. NPDC059679 TaxID=3346903 RepID=UPI00368477BB
MRKTYEGPDAELGLDRERTLLTRLRGRLPVPPGHAVEVLEACGELLRRVHEVGARDEGKVLVHGDYGPNNVLLDPVTFQVTAAVDWDPKTDRSPAQGNSSPTGYRRASERAAHHCRRSR